MTIGTTAAPGEGAAVAIHAPRAARATSAYTNAKDQTRPDIERFDGTDVLHEPRQGLRGTAFPPGAPPTVARPCSRPSGARPRGAQRPARLHTDAAEGGVAQARRVRVYVKEQLGHSSIQITVDTYGHLLARRSRAVGVLRAVALQQERGERVPESGGNPGSSGPAVTLWCSRCGLARRPHPISACELTILGPGGSFSRLGTPVRSCGISLFE
jgi:hypothetical protein